MKRALVLIILWIPFIGCNENGITLNKTEMKLKYSDTLITNYEYFTIHTGESNKEYLTASSLKEVNEIQIIANEYEYVSDTSTILIEINSNKSLHPDNLPLTIQSANFIDKEVYYCKSIENLTFKTQQEKAEAMAYFMKKEYNRDSNNNLDSIYLIDSLSIPFLPFVDNEFLFVNKTGFYLLMKSSD